MGFGVPVLDMKQGSNTEILVLANDKTSDGQRHSKGRIA
jgi:hypothetical protein